MMYQVYLMAQTQTLSSNTLSNDSSSIETDSYQSEDTSSPLQVFAYEQGQTSHT